ncbi:MAG: NUDIX hydrolase [Thermodesulfobacteriota bacterium]
MEESDSLVFNQRFLERISSNLKGFVPLQDHREGFRRAAVAVVVTPASQRPGIRCLGMAPAEADQATLILTRRASKLKHHSGQWAFPGGRLDAGERPEEAALRELWEEVGVEVEAGNVIGRLDDFTTRSGFIISPVVVWVGPGAEIIPNPDEVASVHRIPIAEFMRKDAPILDTSSGERHPVLFMPVGDDWIAAPTAAIIYQFREVAVLGRETRVAHFDQPYFAWQ